MKWVLIVVGVYGCSNTLDVDGVETFLTQEECEASIEYYTNLRKPKTYEYQCVSASNKEE